MNFHLRWMFECRSDKDYVDLKFVDFKIVNLTQYGAIQ